MTKFLKFKHLNIRNLKLEIGVALILGLALFRPTPLYAQSLSLSLWPPLLEVMIQPGKSITQVYKLTNNSDHDLKITPQIFPFEPIGESGQIRIQPLSPTNSKLPTGFFSFDSGEKLGQPFNLPVGQTKEMVLKLALPRENPEKDYYYTLLFSTAEEPLKTENRHDRGGSGSITQIGTNILITVSQLGKPVLLGKIVSFTAPPIIDSFSTVPFEVVLENWGKTLWKPFGQIVTTGIFKQEKEIRLLEQNVLSNSSRRLDIPQFRPKLPLGPFLATLEFSLNEDGPKLFTELAFWYLPYKLVLVVLFLLTVIFSSKRLKKALKISQK